MATRLRRLGPETEAAAAYCAAISRSDHAAEIALLNPRLSALQTDDQ